MNRNLLWQRVGLYSLLRRLYTYPIDEECVAAVMSLSPDDVVGNDGLDAPAHGNHLLAALQQMQEWLAQEETSHRLEALQVEMTRLLEGPGRPLAPPYASYYLNDGQLMGQAAHEALAIYRRWGVAPAGSLVTIPPDHLALELGFLAHLAMVMAEATSTEGTPFQAAAKASDRFLRRHLLAWWPHFYRDLQRNAGNSFFIGLADFTDAALQMDAAWLKALLNPIEPALMATPEPIMNHAWEEN
ncbi:molecular chaperone TorD family protein [Caldilinea sp.]|jgi:TorA maturation chaperone TorD|uniref:TorD/DmsD family molecular chaperone n=1 Tax=Caldilinea sp. TaxID=2293560 RepID=UPI001B11C62B|nr:molecular chaperone TorD family protein [Caldilinea sp.]MBO9394286.1 molecular chaperone TorD family protein [Caldilinea sp.]